MKATESTGNGATTPRKVRRKRTAGNELIPAEEPVRKRVRMQDVDKAVSLLEKAAALMPEPYRMQERDLHVIMALRTLKAA